ncbi:glycosyltransferase family 2 protein [Alkalicoccobacillus murimartini]|uniref:Glycosyltransferase involved in cell wall biosynthesis n=1 Tax=Alkalicoccobacillus murimartini TaxID=171685 RepID=A0ABT9YG23_9BACI|nr:glycosyltransferase family 2 protein [Alkalicoccobacillus murimartini]MDQ0206811.1 glycosyltransferase involved in cell wall biosynthesis [Alkalicoccobacillus murimartini]
MEPQIGKVKLSVLIVLRNEEGYIEKLLTGLINQTLNSSKYEIILVDGMSSDNTVKIINQITNKYPNSIRLLSNPRKTLPPGWNIGIRASKGDYIIRIDGHTSIPNDFLENYMKLIHNQPDVDCVGGIIKSVGNGFQGYINQYVYSHPFGVGNSKFRTTKGVWEGYVDTVPYGAYKREVFDQVGYFNEDLKRNEDIEFHKRMKDNEMTFFLSTSIWSTYFVRPTLNGLIKKSLGDGTWTMIADQATPGSLRTRHKAPLYAFLLGLISVLFAVVFPAFVWFLLAIGIIYIVGASAASSNLVKEKGIGYFLPAIGTFFCLHFFRGLGCFLAFFKKEYWLVRSKRHSTK